MSLDLLIIVMSMVSFMAFLGLHLFNCRRVRDEELMQSLLLTVLQVMPMPVILLALWMKQGVMHVGLPFLILAALMSVLIYGLLCFFYVLCIFGPYETSVRMRLLREIADAKQGITREQMFKNYNESVMVDIRLRRLVGSGDIIKDGNIYRNAGKTNVFFVFDQIASVLKKLIGR